MPTVRVERRLAAIMATDIVAYSRMIGTDEAGTLAAIRGFRSQVLDPLIADHKGRIVKLMGDGAIVEFGSVVDAVACAIAVQQGVTAHQAEVPPDNRIVLRIGINLGDVVVDGDDLFGDGVNVAARLEPLAEPGGICVADAVQRQLAGKTTAAFEDAGEYSLKNIARPVRVWRWTGGGEHGVPTEAPLPLPDKPSVAVLPFDSLGGQADEAYFCDGITEDIITGLARFRSLFVVARNSSFAFRGKGMELAEIGRRLGVSYLLEGSIRRAGDRVRITAQLIEAATGMHLWAERYDRSLDDIFAVQDEVAQRIVATLFGRIEEAKIQQALRTPTVSLAAYDFLLRGLAHFRGHADDDNRKAREMFERAVALDPRYALPHAYLALLLLAENGGVAAPREVQDAALAAARHAVELDPEESRCHRVLAFVWLHRREYDTAEHRYHAALELNPNDADTRMGVGYLFALRGRPEEAMASMQLGMRLNPFHPSWYDFQLAVALYSAQRYEEAAQVFKRLPSRTYWSRTRLAACYVQLGRLADAQAQAAEVLRLKPDFSTAEFLRRDVLLEKAEDREHLREALINAGLPA
ncbi:MAG: adenylate/guanylate cyclase domain-containing protein [Bauldia sp.]